MNETMSGFDFDLEFTQVEPTEPTPDRLPSNTGSHIGGFKMPKHIDPKHGSEAESRKYLEHLASHPTEYIGKYHQTMFSAGGGAVLEFGANQTNPDSLWSRIAGKAGAATYAEIAGVEFKLSDLELMGEFYRWLRDEKSIKFHCIDERLDELESAEAQIHCDCGACKAIGKFLDTDQSIEDELAGNQAYVPEGSDKQPLLTGMHEHASRAIYADLSSLCRAPKADKRHEMKENHALTFNVSIPTELAHEFINAKYQTVAPTKSRLLFQTLVDWNVQIARNIIGSHNKLAEMANHTLLIIDKRDLGVHADTGLFAVLSQVVPASHQLMIN